MPTVRSSALDEIIQLVEALLENKILGQNEKLKMMEEIFEPKVKLLWKHKSRSAAFTIKFFYLLDKLQYYHTSLISDFYNTFHRNNRITNINLQVRLYREGLRLRGKLTRPKCPLPPN